MSMNYFKKLGESAPNDLALYIENCVKGRKIEKHNQYSHARIISAEEAAYSNSSRILFSKDLGDNFCDIWGILSTLLCNDFVERDAEKDLPNYTDMLANFMITNLKGEDKVNYISDFQKHWQNRLDSQYKNKINSLQKSISHFISLVDEKDLSA